MNQDIIPHSGGFWPRLPTYTARARAFTEFSDHVTRMAGNTADKRWTYASVGWHIAQGINNFTSYYSFQDWTEDELRHINLYTARCGQTMRRGKRENFDDGGTLSRGGYMERLHALDGVKRYRPQPAYDADRPDFRPHVVGSC